MNQNDKNKPGKNASKPDAATSAHDFIMYLMERLSACGEDMCSRCAFLPAEKSTLCGNLKNQQPPDLYVCMIGMRKKWEDEQRAPH